MAAGDGAFVLTNHGSMDVSGALLKTTVDGLNCNTLKTISGGGVYIVPLAGGIKVQVISVAVN